MNDHAAQEADEFVCAHLDGVTIAFVRSRGAGRSCFGGHPWRPAGSRFGPRPLHRIGTLSLADLGATSPAFDELPLLYGLRYEGCLLRYGAGRGGIEIRTMVPPRSSADWPYPELPDALPRVHLDVSRRERQGWDEFGDALPGLQLSRSSDLVVVVRSPRSHGVSLWGKAGDDAGAMLAFQCSLEAGTVTAWNFCS